LVRRKHWPTVNWDWSFSRRVEQMAPFYEDREPKFQELRAKANSITLPLSGALLNIRYP